MLKFKISKFKSTEKQRFIQNKSEMPPNIVKFKINLRKLQNFSVEFILKEFSKLTFNCLSYIFKFKILSKHDSNVDL